jgi:hypothetical protein
VGVHICLIQIVVLWAVLSHMALGATPKAPSLGAVLGMLLVHEPFEWEGGVGGIYFHWDNTGIVGARGCV